MSTTTETITTPLTNGKLTDNAQLVLSNPEGYDSDDPTKCLNVIPTFATKLEEREWAKKQMAGAFRVFAKLGYANGVNGHMSLRDPVDPSLFWINPYAKHFASIKVSDLVLVNEKGQYIEGSKSKINAAGFIIHSTIHKERPDINAVCHAHAPYGVAWSSFGRLIEMLTQDSCYFYNDLSVYGGFGGVVLASAEGAHLATALGPKNKNLILQNHGLLTCGSTIAEATAYFITLERACQTQLLAEAAAANGIEKQFVGNEEAEYTHGWLRTKEVMYMQFQPEFEQIVEDTNASFFN